MFIFAILFIVQEKVHLLTEKIESSGNVENSEKLGEGMVNDGVGATKTSFPKKTCKL